jgi:hypothetical protein
VTQIGVGYITRRITPHIDLILGENIPNMEAYRMTHKQDEGIRNHVHESLDKGSIKEILNPCVVPTVLSTKKDGGWILCTDSRAINKITIRYRFPLRMGYLMDFLSGARYFSKKDIKICYHHIRIRGYEWEIGFKTNDGLYE